MWREYVFIHHKLHRTSVIGGEQNARLVSTAATVVNSIWKQKEEAAKKETAKRRRILKITKLACLAVSLEKFPVSYLEKRVSWRGGGAPNIPSAPSATAQNTPPQHSDRFADTYAVNATNASNYGV